MKQIASILTEDDELVLGLLLLLLWLDLDRELLTSARSPELSSPPTERDGDGRMSSSRICCSSCSTTTSGCEGELVSMKRAKLKAEFRGDVSHVSKNIQSETFSHRDPTQNRTVLTSNVVFERSKRFPLNSNVVVVTRLTRTVVLVVIKMFCGGLPIDPVPLDPESCRS